MSLRFRFLALAGVVAATLAIAWWFLLASGGPDDGSDSCSTARPALCEADCKAGDLVSCHTMGEAYYYSGPRQDMSRALQAYTRACRIGPAGRPEPVGDPLDPLGSSCFLAGAIWARHSGAATDRAKAWALYHEGCGHGFAHACEALGEMYETGEGAPRDEVEAHRYFAIACGLESESACVAANRLGG